jgi:putative tricarboxylic transport membrane protein
MVSEQDSLSAFFLNMVSSPLSLILLIAVVLIVLSKTPIWSLFRRTFPRRAPQSES